MSDQTTDDLVRLPSLDDLNRVSSIVSHPIVRQLIEQEVAVRLACAERDAALDALRLQMVQTIAYRLVTVATRAEMDEALRGLMHEFMGKHITEPR